MTILADWSALLGAYSLTLDTTSIRPVRSPEDDVGSVLTAGHLSHDKSVNVVVRNPSADEGSIVKTDEMDRLLDPAPLKVETGYERLPSEVLHVACRTDLHRCTGEMFEWWFRFRPDTQKYIWWHPIDHVSSDWIVQGANTRIGSIHLVEERFTGLSSEKLAIQFRNPDEFFDATLYAEAQAAGRVSAAICGRVGFGFDPPKDDTGRVLGSRVIHLARDTEFGCAL